MEGTYQRVGYYDSIQHHSFHIAYYMTNLYYSNLRHPSLRRSFVKPNHSKLYTGNVICCLAILHKTGEVYIKFIFQFQFHLLIYDIWFNIFLIESEFRIKYVIFLIIYINKIILILPIVLRIQ